MKVGLIHYTEDYHKLVETVARVCYQSYHKDDEKSHNFIKAIMAKGHISVASVGNIVFGVTGFSSLDQFTAVTADLLTFSEINPFVKVTMPDAKKNPDSNIGVIVSMNMLTFLDIYNARDDYEWGSPLFASMLKITDKVPCLRWFYDKTVKLPEEANQYTAKGIPTLYNPILLEEDYTALSEKGLTAHELDVHASVTLNFITDRSAGLQFWRHWAGGCELSQRYVERGTAEFREMVDLDKLLQYKVSAGARSLDVDSLNTTLSNAKEEAISSYDEILHLCKSLNIHQGRAKEIARSVLPNNIVTQIIQNRPYRNWKHLFKLRDSNHAQREIQEDVIHMKKLFSKAGIPTE